MGVRVYKPTSPGRRDGSVNDYAELTTDKPEKTLCKRIKKNGGRNHYGVTTARFRGGGARKIYRIIDFKRKKDNIPATVSTIEYDPNRDCFISLVTYSDGEKRYILAPLGISVGDIIESGESCEPKTGNAMPLRSIPAGMEIHNIE
ncbi:MAG: 50S ribosomal protein L2, partial [Planctomycetota bacterium]